MIKYRSCVCESVRHVNAWRRFSFFLLFSDYYLFFKQPIVYYHRLLVRLETLLCIYYLSEMGVFSLCYLPKCKQKCLVHCLKKDFYFLCVCASRQSNGTIFVYCRIYQLTCIIISRTPLKLLLFLEQFLRRCFFFFLSFFCINNAALNSNLFYFVLTQLCPQNKIKIGNAYLQFIILVCVYVCAN